MKILIISKNLLDFKDAQSQQTLAFIEAMQEVCDHIDVITARTIPPELSSLSYLSEKNIVIHTNDATWVTNGNGLLDKIQRKIERNILATVESEWVKASANLANDLVLKNNYSAIISIGLPIESHMVGLNLKDKSKWIAHFSDPWPESIMPKPYSDYSIPILAGLQRNIVQKIITQAKLISFTCKESRALFARYYRFDIEKTFITPHVAPQPLKSIQRKDGNFIITHAGSLSRERFFTEFFYAIRELPEDCKIIIQFIGNIHSSAQRLVEELGIQKRFIFTGQLSKADTLLCMRKSDALLLIEAKMETYPFLPSKLADYSALSLPIYAITGKDSASAQILRLYHHHYTSTYSVTSIIEALKKISVSHSIENKQSIYEYFDRRNIQGIINKAIVLMGQDYHLLDAKKTPY